MNCSRARYNLIGVWFGAGLVAAGCLYPAQARAEGRQQQGHFETEVTMKVELDYLLFLPEGYEQKAKWPLLVFLHGAGERGDDLQQVKTHGPPKIVESKKDFPFIVLSPQCPKRQWWDPKVVIELVDQIANKYKVDKDRMYMTGLSMGGYGTWATACAYPKVFAAIVPICGGGDPDDAGRIKDLPVWVFHGAKDTTVPIARSEEMVKALKAAGGDVKFTIYPEANHDSWTETYDNPALYQWLLQHKRTES